MLIAECEQPVGGFEIFGARLRRNPSDLQRNVGRDNFGLRDVEVAIRRIGIDHLRRRCAKYIAIPGSDRAKTRSWRSHGSSAARGGDAGSSEMQKATARNVGHFVARA